MTLSYLAADCCTSQEVSLYQALQHVHDLTYVSSGNICNQSRGGEFYLIAGQASVQFFSSVLSLPAWTAATLFNASLYLRKPSAIYEPFRTLSPGSSPGPSPPVTLHQLLICHSASHTSCFPHLDRHLALICSAHTHTHD